VWREPIESEYMYSLFRRSTYVNTWAICHPVLARRCAIFSIELFALKVPIAPMKSSRVHETISRSGCNLTQQGSARHKSEETFTSASIECFDSLALSNAGFTLTEAQRAGSNIRSWNLVVRQRSRRFPVRPTGVAFGKSRQGRFVAALPALMSAISSPQASADNPLFV